MKTRILRSIVSLVCVTLLTGALPALAAESPKVGDKAPLVTGKDQTGKTWSLADLVGKKNVLLYFYPEDFTGGCTKEACSYRDSLDQFKSGNVEVIGVSFDSEESHMRFIETNKLTFSLLADTDGKIADAYGARRPDKNVAKRISFLIDLDGKIVHVTNSPSADVHIKEMKEAIGQLKKS